MPSKPDTSSAEGFVGSVFKFSISTFANIGIYGVALIFTALVIGPAAYGPAELFVGFTNTVMTIAILGLDQALIRFYYKPPAGLSSNGLFRVCFYLSSAALVVGGALGSTLLAAPLYGAIGFEGLGLGIMPLLFLNAFFYMILRYFNVLYRMEQNIRVFTIESILMQFFFKLFYLFGYFVRPADPVWPMILCSVAGLGGFALVFSLMRRRALAPKPAEFRSGGYKTLLPYALGVAPTAVFVTLNGVIPKSTVYKALDATSLGVYSFAYSLSNIVTMVQGGFATFWSAYMFKNYETEQARIYRVHDFINLLILAFFAFLVAVEDIIFWLCSIFNPEYYHAISIFPLMMLGAVFTILCETTVYGNAIAKKPIFDTIGIGLSFVTNLVLCNTLVRQGSPRALYGAAVAVVASNVVMYLFRTFTAQKLYRSIPSYPRTALVVLLASALGVAGTVFAYRPLVRIPLAAGFLLFLCVFYRPEFLRLWRLATGILKDLFKPKKA